MTLAAKAAVNVQHSSASDSWATPADIVERARHVLGGVIDLDPASDSFAQETVRATRYITREENGLVTPWHRKPGTVFLNPPGGKDGKYSRTGQFWAELLNERSLGHVTHAIFVAFSVEALAVTQAYGDPPMLHFPLCIPRNRIRFVDRNNPGKASPAHANVVVYIPGAVDKREVFAEVFGPLGAVRL